MGVYWDLFRTSFSSKQRNRAEMFQLAVIEALEEILSRLEKLEKKR